MASASSGELTGLKRWAPLIAASLAMFIVVVDSTMMNVAVPTIVRDLNTNVSAVQGVIAMYSLVMASLMLLGGKLGAMRGVKKVFVVGVLIYGVGTLVAALSWNVAALAVGWALLEGIGAAMILPLAYALLVSNYSPKQQAVGFGVLGGVAASAAAAGPILGGILTTYASWRWGFAGEVLIAIAILPFVPLIKEKATAEPGTTLDWGGVVLSVAGLFSLVLGLILAGRYGWWEARRPFAIGEAPLDLLGLSPTPLLVLLGLTLLAAFVHLQFRRERSDLTPLIQTRVITNGRFVTGVTANLFKSMVITGLLFILPLYLQSAVGYSAFESGLAILPLSISTFAASLGTSTWSERFSARLLIQAGIGLMILGTILLYGQVSLDITVAQMIVPLGVFGIGLGLLMAHLVNLILSSVDAADSPEASGLNNTLDQLGNSLGTAVVGSLLLTFFLGNVVTGVLTSEGLQSTPKERDQLVVALEDAREALTKDEREQITGQLPEEQRAALDRLLDESVVLAMEDSLLVIGAILVILLLTSSFLPSKNRSPGGIATASGKAPPPVSVQ